MQRLLQLTLRALVFAMVRQALLQLVELRLTTTCGFLEDKRILLLLVFVLELITFKLQTRLVVFTHNLLRLMSLQKLKEMQTYLLQLVVSVTEKLFLLHQEEMEGHIHILGLLTYL